MFFSKKINRQRNVKNLLLKKTDVLKTCGKNKFLGKKIWKKCTNFGKQKGSKYIWVNFFGIIVFSCFSSKKPCLKFLLICFAREIKGFYQSSLGVEVDFREIMNLSPNILAEN